MKFKDVTRMKESTLKRFLRMPQFEEHLELHRLDVLSSNRRLENYKHARQKFEEYSAEHLQPAPLLTGTDLIGMGYEPGPQFSAILHMLEDAQLEGRLGSQADAMEMVREKFPLAD
jgi:poly(A) polymerase